MPLNLFHTFRGIGYKKMAKKETSKNLEDKSKKYIAKDNIRRFFLMDMLRRKPYLKGLTIEQLEGLTQSITSLMSNINHKFERGELVLNVKDESNWEHSSFFRDIIIHNVLDIKTKDGCVTYAGDDQMKCMLTERWTKEKEKLLDALEEKPKS